MSNRSAAEAPVVEPRARGGDRVDDLERAAKEETFQEPLAALFVHWIDLARNAELGGDPLQVRRDLGGRRRAGRRADRSAQDAADPGRRSTTVHPRPQRAEQGAHQPRRERQRLRRTTASRARPRSRGRAGGPRARARRPLQPRPRAPRRALPACPRCELERTASRRTTGGSAGADGQPRVMASEPAEQPDGLGERGPVRATSPAAGEARARSLPPPGRGNVPPAGLLTESKIKPSAGSNLPQNENKSRLLPAAPARDPPLKMPADRPCPTPTPSTASPGALPT